MTEKDLIQYWASLSKELNSSQYLFENINNEDIFKDSVIRDKNNQLIVVYKGDGSDIKHEYMSRSDTYDTGIWFTSRDDIAASYGNVQSYVLNITKPFIFDAKESYWNNIDFDKIYKKHTIKIPKYQLQWDLYDEDWPKKIHKNYRTMWEEVDVNDLKEKIILHINYYHIGISVTNNLSKEDFRFLRDFNDFSDDYKKITEKLIKIFKKIPKEKIDTGKVKTYWKFDQYQVRGMYITVNDLVRYVKKLGGYDGVIIKNVLDGGSSIDDIRDKFNSYGYHSNEDFYKQTEYVIFNKNQMLEC